MKRWQTDIRVAKGLRFSSENIFQELWVTMVRIGVFTFHSVDGHAFKLNDSKQEKCLKWIQFAILMILKCIKIMAIKKMPTR